MKNILYILLTATLLSSCNNWLDVQPYDRVAEDVAFTSVKGFENALNGIYIEMNHANLYGAYLSCEMIELMAQRYHVDEGTVYYHDLVEHKYLVEMSRNRFAGVWEKTYNLIANINKLLENCEKYRDVLSDDYYQLIKGEALGLRAYLHFDIFRLFGPLYEPSNKATQLPYYKVFSLNERPHFAAEEFMNNVITDLREASTLLENDPVRTEGSWQENAYTFTSFRKIRLNWYAVQLLLARAELYRGNKSDALSAARNVIDGQEKWFSWVNRQNISSGKEDADRIFFDEIVFGLRNSKISKLYTSYFNGNTLSSEMLLAPLNSQVLKIFENNRDDYRYIASFSTQLTVGGAVYNLFEKFKSTVDSLSSNLMPMLRVSEAYYIAAECEPEPEDGMQWLNQVLVHRGVKEMTNSSLLASTLEKEYIREFYGEGQLFYYYKRLKYSEIKDSDDPLYVSMRTMGLAEYQPQRPESETKYNDMYN